MNSLFSRILLPGALAGTASAAPYVLPSPQPGALTPYDWQPLYTLEGLYGFAQKSNHPDTCGLRGSFNLYDSGTGSFRHQFDINIGAAWGHDGVRLSGYLPTTATALAHHRYHTDLDLFLLPLTAGYNLNIELWENILLYLGGKVGYAWSHGKLEITGQTPQGCNFACSHSQSRGGFTFSVGAGIKVQCSDVIYVHAGYEFGRSYLDYRLEESRNITYGSHTIYLGIGRRF